ncbi:MAG: TIGR00730 family Rossman fold protein [Vicingaceae bacterium]
MKSIAVFCASAKGASPIYKEKAEEVGKKIAQKGYRLIYGGASIGSMGAVAEGALSAGGEVIGVLPHFLAKREIAQKELHELIMVDSMHERKLKMNELSDGTITLPGGFGTMEEFFEIITWGQLGLHKKPSALLNVAGYYNHLIAQLKHMNEQKLLKDKFLKMILIEEDIVQLLDRMEAYQAPDLEKWLDREKS